MDVMRSLLDGLPAQLAPLANAARSLLDQPCDLSADGVLSFGHRSWVAPQNYTITLYPGLQAEALGRYAVRFGLEVPAIYAAFLKSVNGAFCFGMSLAGVPRSMLGLPPLLDRSRLQCHDLGMTATQWVGEYRKLPTGAFHFGYRHFSPRENIGYFVAGDRILSLRKSGKVVGEWDSLSEFLSEELRASQDLDAELHPEEKPR